MNKPNTKDLRLLANEYFDGRFDSQDVKNILTQCADFIDFLEGKHICEWPKHLTRERLDALANCVHPLYMADRTSALNSLAAIAPEAPKKRMMNAWETNIGWPILIPIESDDISPSWRKVGGPFEVDE